MRAGTADSDEVTGARLSLPIRSVWLLGAKGVQMGGGFLFWIVAARSAPVAEVGVAAAAVSAVMLCTQLGTMGAGSAVIIALGRGQGPTAVLDSAFTVIIAGGLLSGAAYLLVTGPASGSSSPERGEYVLLFLLAALAGTVVICLDQISIALHRTEGASLRYGLGGASSLAAVSALSLLPGELEAVTLLLAWTMGGVIAVVVGHVQLRRWIGYSYRPSLGRRPAWALLRTGVPNQLLTLTERLSPLLVPIILAHVVSPTQAAYWYPAWMMVFAAYTGPISVGLVQFADIVRKPEQAGRLIVSGLMWSLILGGAICVVLAIWASPLLGLLGADYADASAGALRLLTLGLLPFVVLMAYNAYCRAAARTREATILGVLIMTAVAGGTVVYGGRGPTAVALVWDLSTAGASLWAAARLLGVLRRSRARRLVPDAAEGDNHD